MKLELTTEMMLSDDYKERFKAEYHQLTYRIHKIQKLVTAIKKGEKKPPFGCSKYLLICQLDAMKNYKHILELRAEAEGIELK